MLHLPLGADRASHLRRTRLPADNAGQYRWCDRTAASTYPHPHQLLTTNALHTQAGFVVHAIEAFAIDYFPISSQQICDQMLQPPVLFFQLPEPLCLADLKPAIFAPPGYLLSRFLPLQNPYDLLVAESGS